VKTTAGVLAAFLCTASVFGQQPTPVPTTAEAPTPLPTPGQLQKVKPLTPELVQQAVQKGQRATKVSDLCQSFDGIRGAWVGGGGRGFFVSIITPYCGIAVRAFDAKRKYENFVADKVEVPPEEQQFIIVRATPSTTVKDPLGIPRRSLSLASVSKVVLKRGNEIIQPVKSEFEDVTFSNAYGKTEVFKGGSFSFPLNAFGSGKEAVTIVIIPDTGETGHEATKMLTPEDLRRIE
jgi:hypothetical protein